MPFIGTEGLGLVISSFMKRVLVLADMACCARSLCLQQGEEEEEEKKSSTQWNGEQQASGARACGERTLRRTVGGKEAELRPPRARQCARQGAARLPMHWCPSFGYSSWCFARPVATHPCCFPPPPHPPPLLLHCCGGPTRQGGRQAPIPV